MIVTIQINELELELYDQNCCRL